jgi:predicted dehydrogenase
MLDRVNVISKVTLIDRKNKTTEDLSIPRLHNDYYYEIAEFIDIIQSGKRESTINSHTNTLLTMEIMDEVKKQVKNC